MSADSTQDKLSLQSFLPYRCTRLAQSMSVALSRIYTSEFGLSVADWRIIVTLAEHGELTARTLTERTTMDKVRVSRALASLEQRSLVRRRPCEQDSRAALVALTEAGLALYRELAPQALAWEADLSSAFSAGERDTFLNLLDKLETQLAQLGKTAP